MKTIKITLLFFITATLSFGAYSQIADSIYYERLYYTCKVWGHAKYYHSRIAAGEVDWDDALLDALPQIKNATTNQEFNDALLAMLQKASETQSGSEPLPEVPDSLNNNTDISWIYHPIFSNEVSAFLDTIIQRFTPRPNVYVGVHPWGDNRLNFQDSDKKYYSGTQYPDECKRILALFRYWNIIHYFFPYKYIMDQDWETTLIQTIPEVVNASNALEYHLAMRVLTVKINDSHSFFYSTTYQIWRGSYFTPFLARFIEGKVVVTKVHSSISQLSKGDIITKIDGLEINYLRDSLRKYIHGSNEITIENNLIYFILCGNKGSFSLTVLNETGEITLNLSRGGNTSELYEDNTPYWREITLNGCRFGIVHMGNLYEEHIPEVADKLNNVDAVIFDIRNYPNGTLWPLVDYLFETSIHHSNLKWPDKDYPGRFFWYEAYVGQGTSYPVRKKTIILFNEKTLSQAEFTCMGLEQIPGSIKIGSTTAAADGSTSYIRLPGVIEVMASFLGVYYPDYTPTQRVGIIPDYYVHPTIQGIREGRDEVLEFALNCAWIGIEDVVKKEEICVYPNPTTGQLRITNYELRILGVEVFDVLGRKYCFDYAQQQKGEWKKEMGEVVIDISTLPAGFYLLKIMTDGNTYTHKIVKN